MPNRKSKWNFENNINDHKVGKMKFKIFLSSNRQEFHNERRLIKEAIENDIILNRFFKIFSFEEEPASGKTPQNRYSEAVLESDIYIGLLGSK